MPTAYTKKSFGYEHAPQSLRATIAAKERIRVNGRNEWLAALRRSLKEAT